MTPNKGIIHEIGKTNAITEPEMGQEYEIDLRHEGAVFGPGMDHQNVQIEIGLDLLVMGNLFLDHLVLDKLLILNPQTLDHLFLDDNVLDR